MKFIIYFSTFYLLLSACHSSPSNAGSPGSPADTAAQASFQLVNAREHAIYDRAFNAVVWGMPAVNSELMHQSLLQAKGDYNQVVYWSGLINDKNQTLTPNPDIIYINPFYDTRQGPVVLEIPAASGASSITGSVDDGWQTAIEDVGPAGVDKGKGAKYLITPPGYANKIPPGFIQMPSSIYTGYAILRSNLSDKTAQDIARAVEYGKRVKIYPYAQAADPPPTTFVDLLQVPFANIIPYDIRFFEALNSFVQREPWLPRDMAMVDQLKSIGIEKGRPFQPDARTKEILSAAISDAHRFIDETYLSAFNTPFFSGSHWALPVDPSFLKAISENYADPGNYPTDARAVVFSMAYFSSKHLGTGQFYLLNVVDNNNQPLAGAKSYRLHLPPNVPVKLYWSITAYDRETHAVIAGMPYFSRASTSPGIQKNADGSVDVYFGPAATEGKTSNWVPTDPKRGFELMARFYGPEKGFFEKAWTMGDAVQINH
jgi:hypothetical protein